MLEPLESRRLLAGITILAHGLAGNIRGWIKETADGIAERLGGPGAMSVYTMEVDDDGVKSFEPDDGYGDYRNTTTGELVVRLDWSDIDSNPQKYPTDEVAEDVAEYLMQERTSKKLAPLAELPIHLVGHSRGGSLAAEIAKYLGRRGVIVDQTTMLDPVPVGFEILGQDFGDPQLRAWDNVVFVDDYWRSDGESNIDPDGQPLDGAHQGDLRNSVQNDFTISAHNAVTAYYVGTVDLDARNGGDHPIRDSWYAGNNPDRDETGYFFSRIGGGERPSDGLGLLGRGSAPRRGTGESGTQWPGAVELKPRGGSSFLTGQNFTVTLRGGDRDGRASVTLYLDSDRNPYNGAGSVIGTAKMSGAVADRVFGVSSSGVAPGTYALAARMSDAAGQTRWFYGKSVTINQGPTIGVIEDRTLKVSGGAESDFITIGRASSDLIFVTLNGFTANFVRADFDLIEVLCGAGDDTLTSDASMPKPIYAFGDAGRDSLTGGGGNDTLSGGADRNFLDGNDGEDRLNGSGAPDTLWGGNGDDRLYGNGGDDSFEGGGGINRAFGGDGNDLIVGGGSNDKLYGEAGDDTLYGKAGADILDGGDGNDSAEDDDDDNRVSVEVLV